jgi:hypothetical protein
MIPLGEAQSHIQRVYFDISLESWARELESLCICGLKFSQREHVWSAGFEEFAYKESTAVA